METPNPSYESIVTTGAVDQIREAISWIYRNRDHTEDQIEEFNFPMIEEIVPFIYRRTDSSFWEGQRLDSHDTIGKLFGFGTYEQVLSGFRVAVFDIPENLLVFNNFFGLTQIEIDFLCSTGFLAIDANCKIITVKE